MDQAIFLLYLGVKALAYMAWCGLGARIHGHRDRIALKGFVYGLIRLAMGAVLGLVLILWLVNALYGATRSELTLYLAVYVPVRWLEWSSLAVLMGAEQRSPSGFLLGTTAGSRLWRAGGILISCLADLPVILGMGGLPVGRFMC